MRPLKAIIGMLVILAAGGAGLYLTQQLLASPNAGVISGRGDSGPLPVETIPVESETFSDNVRAVGTARARQAVDLVVETGGRISSINFNPGTAVKKGEILLELDNRAELAELKAAEATLAEAQAAFARQERLNSTGNASDAVYQTAKSTLLRAEAARDQAQAALDDRRLLAPFDGVVGLTDLVEGQIVDPATKIATLDDLSVIEVDFSVPEILLPRLKMEQRLEITTAAWPGRVFTGKISRIDTRVDAATRSVGLRAEIPNDDRALAGGMFLQVMLVLDERQGPSIPEQILTVDGDRKLVLIAKDGKAQEVEVKTGQQLDGQVEIVSGLEPGAQLIVTNLHRVAPDMEIKATVQNRRVEGTGPVSQ